MKVLYTLAVDDKLFKSKLQLHMTVQGFGLELAAGARRGFGVQVFLGFKVTGSFPLNAESEHWPYARQKPESD